MILTPGQPDPGESATARLYRATLGDASASRYLSVFARFDDQGMAGPTWNSAGALFHLGWLVHHRLWLSLVGCTALAAAVTLAVTGLWQLAPGWPTGIKLGASLAMVLGAMLVPGLWGTAWLHTRSRRRMINAVELAATVDGACVALNAEARDRQRRNTWGLAGLLSVGVLAALLWQTVPWSTFTGAAQPSRPEAKIDPVAEVPPATAVMAATQMVSPQASASPHVEEATAASTSTPAKTQISDQTPMVTPEVLAKPGVPVVSAKRQVSSGSPKATAITERATPVPVGVATPPVKILPKSAAPSPESSAVEPASALVPVTKTPGIAPATKDSSPSSPTAQATTPAAAALTGVRTRVNGFGVAVGMFAVADNAERVASRLADAGLPVLRDPVDSARGRLTRVRVGPFDRQEQAEVAAEKIKALGLDARVYSP